MKRFTTYFDVQHLTSVKNTLNKKLRESLLKDLRIRYGPSHVSSLSCDRFLSLLTEVGKRLEQDVLNVRLLPINYLYVSYCIHKCIKFIIIQGFPIHFWELLTFVSLEYLLTEGTSLV